MQNKTQPWLYSPAFDLAFITGPAVLVIGLVVIFQTELNAVSAVPGWLWLLLVVGVDVSHVYSTLFRTYLDREEFKARQALYTLVPLGAWLSGCFLYSVDALVFWRVLAYLAVFHFIRQQYGFMMIYSRNEYALPKYYKQLDKIVIYIATLHPLIYWHCHERSFNWFVDNDFFFIDKPWISNIAGITYSFVLLAYFLKEIRIWKKSGQINLPKNLLIISTAISWHIGIVAFDNDLIFTATNIIAHGIPYIALIWAYGHNHREINKPASNPFVAWWISKLFTWKTIPLYITVLFSMAYLEEWIWDGFIWRDHTTLFRFSETLPTIQSEQILVWFVPLLVLPQATHYILDAFIWRLNLKHTNWKQVLFYHANRN